MRTEGQYTNYIGLAAGNSRFVFYPSSLLKSEQRFSTLDHMQTDTFKFLIDVVVSLFLAARDEH